MTLDMEIQDMKRRIAIRERAKGLKEGRKIGKAEGRKEGIKEGRKEYTIEIAKNLLAEGVDIDKVVRITKLSKAEVAALA